MAKFSRPLGALVLLGLLAFASFIVTIAVSIGIWPGEAKLTAPLLCDAAHPDPVVVADTSSVRPGETTTSFTLYCLGPRGEAVNAGWMRPFLLLWAAHALLIAAVLVLSALVRGGLLPGTGRRGDAGTAQGLPAAAPPRREDQTAADAASTSR